MKELFSFLPAELAVLFTAVLPVIELRGAIPVGMSLGLSPLYATALSFIGSMFPVPFILLAINPIFDYLKTTKLFSGLVERLTHRSLTKNAAKVQKYGAWGLILFVAIPLPGTGVWSGCLAAALLGIRFKRAFFSVLLGNFIAAIAVVTLSNGVGLLIRG